MMDPVMFSTPVSKSSDLKNPPAISKKSRDVDEGEDIDSFLTEMMSKMTISFVSRKLVF